MATSNGTNRKVIFYCRRHITSRLCVALDWADMGKRVNIYIENPKTGEWRKVSGILHRGEDVDDFDEIYRLNETDYGAVSYVKCKECYYICLPNECFD